MVSFVSLRFIPLFAVLALYWIPVAAQAADQPAQTPANESKPELTPEMRGDIMMARKMYREALDYYKPGADHNAVLANKVGIAYHQMLDLKNAKRWYQKAIKLNPRYAEAINNLGTVYYAEKSYRRAIDQYKKALRVNEAASVLSNLGTAYFARKQYEEAMKCYQQALALDPNVFEHRNSQGSLVQERSVEERAKLEYYMAKAYAKSGAIDRALQYIRRSLEDGFKDREKFLKEPEFAGLQDNAEFKQIMAMELKVL
jgi:tetratricopeptide (TPR) repeat protein